jgi:CMP-N,N'-diacetyllegionaminic acid synthase
MKAETDQIALGNDEKTMKTLCIIPARGGSKGIPRKNLRVVAGKPLIVWSIDAALAAKSVDRLIVSTDDDQIAEVALQWSAEVVRRPPELAGDTASSESALLHVMDALRQHERYEPDLILFLQPTSPYRWASDIDGAVNLLLQGGYDSVFSACPEHFTGRWSLGTDLCASPLNFDPAHRPRRQDRPVEYLENGSIYVFRSQILRELGARMGGRIGLFAMPAERSHQIDGIEDLEFFDRLMAGHHLSKGL